MGIVDKFKNFIRNTKRIIRVARRPTFKEVRLIARVSGIGILLTGGLAFLLSLLGNLFGNLADDGSNGDAESSIIHVATSMIFKTPEAMNWFMNRVISSSACQSLDLALIASLL